MRTNQLFQRSLALVVMTAACALFQATHAQTSDVAQSRSQQQQPRPALPTVEAPRAQPTQPVAGQTDLYCAGFIQTGPMSNLFEIVGAEQEQEQHTFSQGNVVIINAGAQQGVREGQEFAVVRPRGKFKTAWTKKTGSLGIYYQELGRLRVRDVKANVSVAVVTNSCEMMRFGDLLAPVPQRVAPLARSYETPLDHFSDPTGKQTGRVVYVRDGREMPSRSSVVFIDLGAEDNIRPGDYFTIYRPLGTGNLRPVNVQEVQANTSPGFGSEQYKGGEFSNNSMRAGESKPGVYDRAPITTPEIKATRPAMPRKVVGELVVLSVEGRTATAVITRVTQEVHTGDFVELQ